MQNVEGVGAFRRVSLHAFWMSAVLLVAGSWTLLGSLRSVMDWHSEDPQEGQTAFFVAAACLLAGLLTNVASMVAGIAVWRSTGKTCVWPILSSGVLLITIMAMASVIAALVHGML